MDKGISGLLPTEDTVRSHQLVLASLELPKGLSSLLKHVMRALIRAKPQNPEMYIYAFLSTMLRQRDKGMLDPTVLDDEYNGVLAPAKQQNTSGGGFNLQQTRNGSGNQPAAVPRRDNFNEELAGLVKGFEDALRKV